jgi:ankyrin repeat protein
MGACTDITNNMGNTPLMLAFLPSAEYSYEYTSNVSKIRNLIRNLNWNRILHGKFTCVTNNNRKRFDSKGIEPIRHTNTELTSISEEVVEALLAKTKDLSAKNCHGNTLLHLFISFSINEKADFINDKIFEYILKNTNHINTPNDNGNTPIFEVLTSYNYLIYIKCFPTGKTKANVTKYIEKLMAYGAKVSVMNHRGDSPLHLSLSYGFSHFVKAKGNAINMIFLLK